MCVILFFPTSFRYNWRVFQPVQMAKLLIPWVTTRIILLKSHLYLTITLIILKLESHSRRRICWSGRWKGKDMVRVQRIWRFRYGPPTHLKGLHHMVCIIFSCRQTSALPGGRTIICVCSTIESLQMTKEIAQLLPISPSLTTNVWSATPQKTKSTWTSKTRTFILLSRILI
jgi:hypothetical protein